MSISFGPAPFTGILILAATALVTLASIGMFLIGVHVWRKFKRWAAHGHLEQERRRAQSQLARHQRIADEREHAMLTGASTVARVLVQTIVDAQLRQMAVREADHRQEYLKLLRAAAQNELFPQSVEHTQHPNLIDVVRTRSPIIATDPKNRSYGHFPVSSIRRMLLGLTRAR